MKLLRALWLALAALWLAWAAFGVYVHFSHPAVGASLRAGCVQTKAGQKLTRHINAAGLELIKRFEGCRLTTYRCSANKCTIGFGHTGADVRPGMTITAERAEELLRADLAKAERAVSELVKVPISSNQHAVLVSFVFNLGAGCLKTSTLLKMLNAKDYSGAGNQLTRFVHAGGQILAGLQRRRNAERELWFTPG